MKFSAIHFILFVSDQQSATDFYTRILKADPILKVSGMTEFNLEKKIKLGLMPENGIAKIITPALDHPVKGNGIPRCELYLVSETAKENFDHALREGAKLVSPFIQREWGHSVGYVADSDGNVLAFASA